jgi:hypothetical protein
VTLPPSLPLPLTMTCNVVAGGLEKFAVQDFARSIVTGADVDVPAQSPDHELKFALPSRNAYSHREAFASYSTEQVLRHCEIWPSDELTYPLPLTCTVRRYLGTAPKLATHCRGPDIVIVAVGFDP